MNLLEKFENNFGKQLEEHFFKWWQNSKNGQMKMKNCQKLFQSIRNSKIIKQNKKILQ